jgi:hypothetical protein
MKPCVNDLDANNQESSMNWPMPPRSERRIGTATAVATLIAVSALIVPIPAFATPPPFNAPGGALGHTKLVCQTNYTNIPTTNGGGNDKDTSSDYTIEDNDDV